MTSSPDAGDQVQRSWRPLIVLGTAQFLMVLDTAVMNVSISQLVKDFDTEVTTIQAVITFYSLVMAAFMITGGKLGDLWGRRRAFIIGLVVYGIGSLLTSVAPTVAVLALGWSLIEGLGAALVLPCMVALVAGNYTGKDRALAYGVLGGLSGAGVAVGPLLGGWVTTNLTWRLVFAGEVVIVIGMLATVRWVRAVAPTKPAARLDVVGVVLSAAGLALIVLGVLQSGTWGWLRPRNSPWEPLGFALTPFVIAGGFVLLALFRLWEGRTERLGRDPLVRFALFKIVALRSGLIMVLAQGLILLGLFFVIPLFLQVVHGLSAFDTGVRLLPVSVTMLAAAAAGPVINRAVGSRTIVQISLVVLFAADLLLLATIKPELNGALFALSMAVLGIGMGLLASQLGNIVQGSVGEADRSEAGGLQFTAQNLGGSLGTALMGSFVIGGLVAAVGSKVAADPTVSNAVKDEVGVRLEAGLDFVPASQVQAGLKQNGVSTAEANTIVDHYLSAQLIGLKAALLAAAAIILISLWFTRHLPTTTLSTAPATDGGAEEVTDSGVPGPMVAVVPETSPGPSVDGVPP